MNALIKAPRRTAAALPVQAIDELARKVRELVAVRSNLDSVLHEQERLRQGDDYRPELLTLPALPAHIESTTALATEMSKPPAVENILDALSVLAGVYGARGDAETIASIGVELIQAERASRMALYAATVALLRPVPGERPSSANGWNGVPDMPWKFMPTLSEFIAELREQQRKWQWLISRVEALPAHYAEAQKGLQASKAA